MRRSRGDTIVEVILAFGIFALITVSTIYLMNRSLSTGQRSLEMTLVRQQVDSQAELLRYIRDTNHPVWQSIKSSALSGASIEASPDSCPASLSSSRFALALQSNTVSLINLGSSVGYEPASYYSRVGMTESKSYGLWITPVAVEGSADTYDMYIQACWNSVGADRPQTVSTIVRLYDT